MRTNSLPDGYYVQSMRFGGHALTRGELDLSSGAAGTLEILLSSKPAEIAGTVRDSEGEPVTDVAVGVWAKDDPEIRTARTDSTGRFSVRGLAPGEYKVLAWESIEPGVIWNSAFRASFESHATTVTTSEGTQSNFDLKLIPKAAVEVELAKLP
jgi:sarcosine oxidase gamma subunit